LIVLFALVFFQYQASKWYLLWLSLLGSMMILNRMDTVLLFLPALLSAWYRASTPKLKALRTMLLAFTPFLVWELFSLFYYGFLFPNTAYAKLNTGLSTGQLWKQGGDYLISSFHFDPLLFIILVSAVLFVVAQRDWKSLPLLFGMALYLGYVVNVGGDFMAGRFLTPPFLMAVILLVRTVPSSSRVLWVSILILVVTLGFFVPNSRWCVLNADAQWIDAQGVADEHAYYAGATGLLTLQRGVAVPDNGFAQIGREARLHHDQVLILPSIGYAGYEAGPQVYVLDPLALGDPLLARLPLGPGDSDDWRIGHFQRQLPAGYLETLETGANRIQDPGLAAYYAHLHEIISGPLFDGPRLLEIWSLNTGAYNGLLDHYIHSLFSQSLTSHSFSLVHWHGLRLGEEQWVEAHLTPREAFCIRSQRSCYEPKKKGRGGKPPHPFSPTNGKNQFFVIAFRPLSRTAQLFAIRSHRQAQTRHS
jgi:arabinofuranosyltransferase